MRKMSAKARRYMLAYLLYDQNSNNRDYAAAGLSYAEIEKMSKAIKCHRSAFDQDHGFISRLWREMQGSGAVET